MNSKHRSMTAGKGWISCSCNMHPLPWQPEETFVYSALIMLTKTLKPQILTFVFSNLSWSLFLLICSILLQIKVDWLPGKKNSSQIDAGETAFASLCPSSLCQAQSLSPFHVCRPPWSSGEPRGLQQITDLTWQVQLQTITGRLQTN